MKRILAICVIAIFLITSLGIISAAEDSTSISVKVVGDDLPDQITVKLLCDGKIVDTAVLSSVNSWKTTFNVDEDGEYKITTKDADDYSVTVKGDADKGFVITTKVMKQDVLGVANGDEADDSIASVENNDDGNASNGPFMAANDENASGGAILGANASAGGLIAANNSGNSSNGTNATNSTDDNATSNDDSNDNKKTTSKKTVTKKTVTKKVKQKPVKKQPKKATKTKYKTGFPIAVLVVAAMVAIFVPFSRKR